MTNLSSIISLLMAIVAVSAALPIRARRQQTVKHYIISWNTGMRVQIHEDGDVIAGHGGADGYQDGVFTIRDDSIHISFHSEDYNGSFLHFVQFVAPDCNSTSNSTENGTDILNGTDALNDTDAANCTDFTNGTSVENDTVPSLSLVLGAIDGLDEDGIILHHMWKEEQAPGFAPHFKTYSVTLEDGTVCYLAFEMDGSPVENPCQDVSELGRKSIFFTFHAF